MVADGYCNDNERTKLGTVNRIYDCFITLWGDLPKWEYINGYDRWINDLEKEENKIILHSNENLEQILLKYKLIQKIK